MALVTARNTLSHVKPMSVKLQKRSNDIYKAYTMIKDTEDILDHVRSESDVEFSQWFGEAERLANSVGTEPRVPRLAGRQKRRTNVPHENAETYFRRSLLIPFVDHILQELKTR